MTTKTVVEWTKNGTRSETDLSTRTTWRIKGAEYRVIRAVSKLKAPTAFYATVGEKRSVISRHRTKKAAMRACERHFKSNQP